MNGYVCIWNGQRTEVYADTLYKAKQKAIEEFSKATRKKVRPYQVSVMLAEKDGETVVHKPLI